jgi:hypothetical protein
MPSNPVLENDGSGKDCIRHGRSMFNAVLVERTRVLQVLRVRLHWHCSSIFFVASDHSFRPITIVLEARVRALIRSNFLFVEAERSVGKTFAR